MKIYHLALLITVAFVAAPNKTKAQRLSIQNQHTDEWLESKKDSLIKTAPGLRIMPQSTASASNFAKKPQYGKDGAPVPMPNAYQPSRDTSVAIPTLRIAVDSLSH